MGPCSPFSPCGPVDPLPLLPDGPAGPAGPGAPVGPGRPDGPGCPTAVITVKVALACLCPAVAMSMARTVCTPGLVCVGTTKIAANCPVWLGSLGEGTGGG